MAELLIKAMDSRMPTIEEWKTLMCDRLIPAAEAFVAENVGIPKAIDDFAKLETYVDAKKKLQAHSAGTKPLPPEEVSACVLKVVQYENAPLVPAEVDFAVAAQRDVSREVPSLAIQHKYHQNVLEVEATKADAVKAAELAEKDRRGCHKAMDIIDIRDDDFEWSSEERPPNFIHVLIEGYHAADLQYLRDPIRGVSAIQTRHRYWVDLAGLGQDEKDRYVILADQFDKHIIDKAKV